MAKRIYYQNAKQGSWDADEFGNEWTMGRSVYFVPTDERDGLPYEVYEDDGDGNGNFVDAYQHEDDAKRAVDWWAASH